MCYHYPSYVVEVEEILSYLPIPRGPLLGMAWIKEGGRASIFGSGLE